MRFIIFTRTMWDEPPRLRRQVATMLLDHGHEVHFFQKRKLGGRAGAQKLVDRLTLYTGPHFLHHQLKIFSFLNAIDAGYLKRIIKSQIDIRDDDVVLNFCYDFYFLRDLYPENTMIHIVNDDYISAAIRPHKRSAEKLLQISAEAADHNLVTSYANLQTCYPISGQINHRYSNVSLFLPWARHRYERPSITAKREEILYWGFINDRIDKEKVIAMMDGGLKVNFIGMITRSRVTDQILGHGNAIYHGIHSLEDIPEVIERCACALMSYDKTFPYISSVTMGNRGFELLSFGLPLLFCDLPHLLQAPEGVIYRCESVEDYRTGFARARENFDQIQPTIEMFLTDHYVESRYAVLMDTIAAIREPGEIST